MERLKKAESYLVRLEGALLVFLLSVMVVLSFAQVLLRQFFETGILWADTFLRHLVLWGGFLGAALASAEGRHFAWEAVVPREGRSGAEARLLVQLVTAVVAVFLTKASWIFLMEEKASGSVLFYIGETAVPAWIFALILPLGFALVLIHTLMRAACAASDLKK